MPNNGTGSVTVTGSELTMANGVDGVAATAQVRPAGSNNDITVSSLAEVGGQANGQTIRFLDSGDRINGSALAVYRSTAGALDVYIQNGATTACNAAASWAGPRHDDTESDTKQLAVRDDHGLRF